jgi:cytochrome c oxidase assembly protein subunit 11
MAERPHGGLARLAMIGLAFASVPLYRLFCQVTGFGGTPLRADEIDPLDAAQRQAHLGPLRRQHQFGPALAFKPEERVQRVAVGARDMAFYTAKNLRIKPVTGTATFNVTPVKAGQYFTKIQCFCFTEQTLKPGEEVRMPVIFFVDPKIMDDPGRRKIEEITLSYTFYPVDQPKNES